METGDKESLMAGECNHANIAVLSNYLIMPTIKGGARNFSCPGL